MQTILDVKRPPPPIIPTASNWFPFAQDWGVYHGFGFPWGAMWAEFTVEGVHGTVLSLRFLPGPALHAHYEGAYCPVVRPEWWERRMLILPFTVRNGQVVVNHGN